MARFLLALLSGLLGTVIGAAAGIGIGLILVELLAISCFEGACGYFVVLIGLIGALVGFIGGIVLAVRWSRRAAPAG